MTQTPKSSTGALWARFRFSVVGPLLSSPPARIAQDNHSLACREDVASSCDRMRRSVHRGQHRALVLHGATRARRSAPCLAPRRAQRLRQGIPRPGAGRAAPPPVLRSSSLELPIAL